MNRMRDEAERMVRLEASWSAQRGDHAETEARADRLSDFYDPYPLAGWAQAGIARDDSVPGTVAAPSPHRGSDPPSTQVRP